MSKSSAWLLELTGGNRVVVAEYEMIEYVMSPRLHAVPLTPEYARSVLEWQGRMIACIDFGVILGQGRSKKVNTCVLAFQEAPGMALEYTSVVITAAPVKILVDDDQLCSASEKGRKVWSYLAACWIKHEGQPVPILNVSQLETGALSENIKDYRKENIVEYLKVAD